MERGIVSATSINLGDGIEKIIRLVPAGVEDSELLLHAKLAVQSPKRFYTRCCFTLPKNINLSGIANFLGCVLGVIFAEVGCHVM